MPAYLIERNVPGVHKLSGEELHQAANTSCDALEHLGSDIQWQESSGWRAKPARSRLA